MKIYLDSNPSDAPGCLKIVAADGRDILIQTDWDWPGVASTFGWCLTDVKPEAGCEHDDTDGTVDCKRCRLKAGNFIYAARQWLDDNDGAEAEDPGYFED